jgi:hypothetical protein
MIDVVEHFYDDDPSKGHPDVRTRLRNVAYFFLGNGLIQAAIQIAPSGEGTPVGLLIMDPDRLAKKRESLTMDSDTGLERTMIRIRSGRSSFFPKRNTLQALWSKVSTIPTVHLTWQNSGCFVSEFFYCPRLDQPVLLWQVRIKNLRRSPAKLKVQTGLLKDNLEEILHLTPGNEQDVFYRYTLDQSKKKVHLESLSNSRIEPQTLKYWEDAAKVTFGHRLLDHYFDAARFQLPAVISQSGRVDGSIWQYNREWVRDQAMMAVGLTLSGHHGKARAILQRLTAEFVTDKGETIDSSEKRHPNEVELDQNGVLLYALRQYALWTNDLELLRLNWKKIRTIAGFPLQRVFRHLPSGLLANIREYWERHRAHGIKKGIELAHQLFTSSGLFDAALLARMIGRRKEAIDWEAEAERIKQAMISHKRFGLVEGGKFVKRRGIDGMVQDSIQALSEAQLPEGVPLSGRGTHFLNPDTSTVLPIALGFVSPSSDLARSTLESIETLWNQGWEDGGYGRYHISSEPDSPGPWPFPSLFVARAYAEMQDATKVWRILDWLNSLPGALSGSWFEFYGERLAPPFPQVGITPWTWAELLILLVHHIIGVHPHAEHLHIQPKLLPGISRIQASFPIRHTRLDLDIESRGQRGSIIVDSNCPVHKGSEGEAKIAYSKDKIQVKISIAKL